MLPKISYLVGILIIVLIACKKDENCDMISCMNGGDCNNGHCDCQEMYEGEFCQDQKTPSRIVVSAITVTNFPPTEEDGGGWDLLDGPDIYIQVYKDSLELHSHPTFFEDAVPTNEYIFEVDIDFDAPKDRYTIYLFDYDDFDADDFMGGIEFTPYSNSNGFPTILDVTLDNLSFELDVEYEFD